MNFGINIIGMIISVFILFLTRFNSYINKKKKITFLINSIAMIIITTVACMQSILLYYKPSFAYVILNITQGIIFSITPVMPLMLSFAFVKISKKVTPFQMIPYVINFGFCIASMFVKCIFHYDADTTYRYGMFYFIPIVVGVYSLVFSLYYMHKSLNYGSQAEIAFIMLIYIISGVSFGLEFLTKTNYLFYNTIPACQIAYFAMISILDVRKDGLSTVYNRSYFDMFMKNIDGERGALIVMYDLNGLKKTNDTLGHKYGDMMIESTGRCLLSVYGKVGRVFRYGGDEFFVVILDESKFDDIEKLKERFNHQLGKVGMSAACGSIEYNKNEDLKDTLKKVDELMYQDKTISKKTREDLDK